MPEPLPARPNGPLAVTKGHLYALGALSFAMSALTFFIGLQMGRGGASPAQAPVVSALLDEEARTGKLETLLMRVEATHSEAKLIFPTELPKSAPPMAPLVEPDPAGALVDAAAAAEPVVPPPSILPPAPAPEGSANLASTRPGPSASDALPDGGWAVQVATRENVDEAERLVQTLRATGLAAYRLEALVEGKPEHRIRVSGYSSQDAATAALSDVRTLAGVNSATVTKAP